MLIMLGDETELVASIMDGDVDDWFKLLYSQTCGQRWDFIVLEEVTLCEDRGPPATQLIVSSSARVERADHPKN